MSSYAPFTCAWERLTVPGLESFSLLPVTAGWSLSGTIVTLHEGIAADSRYEIYCDHSWRTQRAVIEIRFKGTTRTLGIAAGNGHWAVDNREVRELEGCVDIDLGWSPSTNLLPIRRLNLAVGGDSGTGSNFPILQLSVCRSDMSASLTICIATQVGTAIFPQTFTSISRAFLSSMRGFGVGSRRPSEVDISQASERSLCQVR